MEYKYLGRTGLKVSPLCLGSMQFGWTANEKISFDILNESYQAGINFIDTADIYSSWVPGNAGGVAEEIIGKWLKKSSIPRHKVIIATKVRGKMGDSPNDEGLSRAHILQAVDDSLQRLGTDYIDLYQTHWYDEQTPIEETLTTLDDLVRQGKVRYIGCSNHPAWRLVEALWTSKHNQLTSYESLQPHYNLVHRKEFEEELSLICLKYGIGVIPYSPLAGGFLTGKYRRGQSPESARSNRAEKYFNERNWELLDLMETLGYSKGGYSISQVALAWLMANPIVTSPIIGPRAIEQLRDNLKALDLKLSNEEINSLKEVTDWK
jgi:aryl-alcohol dehydrogenase-like predicted oxidoreductase